MIRIMYSSTIYLLNEDYKLECAVYVLVSTRSKWILWLRSASLPSFCVSPMYWLSFLHPQRALRSLSPLPIPVSRASAPLRESACVRGYRRWNPAEGARRALPDIDTRPECGSSSPVRHPWPPRGRGSPAAAAAAVAVGRLSGSGGRRAAAALTGPRSAQRLADAAVRLGGTLPGQRGCCLAAAGAAGYTDADSRLLTEDGPPPPSPTPPPWMSPSSAQGRVTETRLSQDGMAVLSCLCTVTPPQSYGRFSTQARSGDGK